MHDVAPAPANTRHSIAFLGGAIGAAVASLLGVLSLVPDDVPGRMPSPAELTVLGLWVLAMGLGHRLATRRHAPAEASRSFGETARQTIWGAVAFLLLAALTMLVAPILTLVAAPLATALARSNATLTIHVFLLVPMGLVLALGTGAVTGSLVRRRA